jgi:hypothetical protein
LANLTTTCPEENKKNGRVHPSRQQTASKKKLSHNFYGNLPTYSWETPSKNSFTGEFL